MTMMIVIIIVIIIITKIIMTSSDATSKNGQRFEFHDIDGGRQHDDGGDQSECDDG